MEHMPPSFRTKALEEQSKIISNEVVLAPNAPFGIDAIKSYTVGRDQKMPMPAPVVYLLGKITYYDIFPSDKIHTTKFCLMYSGGPTFLFCPKGQAMD